MTKWTILGQPPAFQTVLDQTPAFQRFWINPRLSNGSGSSGYPSEYEPTSFGSLNSGTNRSIDISSSQYEFSSSSQDNGSMAPASTSQSITKELHRWKLEEGQRLEEARIAEEAALALAEREKAKCRAAIEAAEAAQRIAELESHKRKNAEMKALKESEEKKRALNALANGDLRYRKYTIDEIEEATSIFQTLARLEKEVMDQFTSVTWIIPVAVKFYVLMQLKDDLSFSRRLKYYALYGIQHGSPAGSLPKYGCLVYEYMANGSLDDRLFCRGGTPVLSWQLRFRIAAEIGTGLLFLHQAKPEPLVHRDLKPALKCAELRKKDRPDLGKVILPELNRLRELAEETMPFIGGGGSSSSYSQVSTNQDFTSDSQSQQSGDESS
ncbi:hypothetical protein LWI28_008575 [Acer negundo]|uniref:RING-type E3 ubiquitin transferase n=1 Tax=Acer negundo TaxID=4023 RepID=A0AAD5NZA8_ACENE|nr:hypothetical protein LWI28_008575 [Acer negundo]